MKVVVVNEGLGYPPNRGNWLRTLNLLLPLAARHDITYLCRGSADREATERARRFYADHGIRAIITRDHPPESRGPAFYARLAVNLLSPLPYSVSAHRSGHVTRAIDRLACEEKVDLWQFEAISYADALRGRKARTLVMTHNVESLIWERMRSTERRLLRRAYIGHQWTKYERFEARVLRDASRVVAVSREDAALFGTRFGLRDVAVVDNGVDVAHYAGVDRSVADPREILFVGSLDWRPNIDAIDLLLDEILPPVLEAVPDARLRVVGRNPSPALARRIRAQPRAELHADVPDVRPFLGRAGVLAVPLRIGGGSRLKILEAVAAGLPVVSSRVGAEGLTFEPDRDLRVVESPAEMATALVEAIRHPEREARRVRAAREVVEARYDWRRLADQLEGVWLECVGREARSSETL